MALGRKSHAGHKTSVLRRDALTQGQLLLREEPDLGELDGGVITFEDGRVAAQALGRRETAQRAHHESRCEVGEQVAARTNRAFSASDDRRGVFERLWCHDNLVHASEEEPAGHPLKRSTRLCEQTAIGNLNEEWLTCACPADERSNAVLAVNRKWVEIVVDSCQNLTQSWVGEVATGRAQDVWSADEHAREGLSLHLQAHRHHFRQIPPRVEHAVAPGVERTCNTLEACWDLGTGVDLWPTRMRGTIADGPHEPRLRVRLTRNGQRSMLGAQAGNPRRMVEWILGPRRGHPELIPAVLTVHRCPLLGRSAVDLEHRATKVPLHTRGHSRVAQTDDPEVRELLCRRDQLCRRHVTATKPIEIDDRNRRSFVLEWKFHQTLLCGRTIARDLRHPNIGNSR